MLFTMVTNDFHSLYLEDGVEWGNYMRPAQTGVSSYRSPYISFHAFTSTGLLRTGLKMNSNLCDFGPVHTDIA